MHTLSAIEFVVCLVTSIYVAQLIFPGMTSVDFAGFIMAAFICFSSLARIIIWIKNWTGGDFQ